MNSSRSFNWSRQLRLIISGFIIVTFTTFHTLLLYNEPDNLDDRRHLMKAPSEIFIRGRSSPGLGNGTKVSSASLSNPTPYPSVRSSKDELSARVACIIPYIGSSLPVWFDAFAFSALSSSPMFDYLIFVTEVPNRELPSNVRIIQISRNDFYERIARLDLSDVSEYTLQQNMISAERLMTLFPYALVEFKPCLGVIFSDHLTTYSHWALADLDVLVGKMQTMITPSILNQYDIYTSSFGDNFRLYMRGQLAIHKNTEYVNNIWRGCHHLSHLTERFKSFRDSGFKVWKFQSAEGCYSSVVVNDKNLSILVATTQLSEAYNAVTKDLESFMYGESLYRCNSKQGKNASKDTMRQNENSYISTIQSGSAWHPVRRVKSRCSPWIHPEFEVCLEDFPPNSMLQVVSGASSFKAESALRGPDSLGGLCTQGAISHFQRWKRGYYHFSTRPPPLDAHLTLLTETGFIPLRLRNGHKELSYGDLLGLLMPLGRMTASEVQAAARGLSLSDGVDNLNSRDLSGESGGRTIPRLVGYSSSEKSKNSSNLFVPSGLSTVYCAAFSLDLKKCICNIHGDQIAVRRSSCGSNTLPHSQVILNSTTEIESESNVLTLLRSSDFSGTKDKKRTSPCTSFAAVTLITVASFEEYQAGILDSMLESWCGPKIVVVSVSPQLSANVKRTDSYFDENLTVIEVATQSCAGVEGRVSNESSIAPAPVPDNMLYNIGLDSAGTDLVCLSPSNAIFHPSDALIFENQLKAQKVMKRIGDELPIALVVPLYYALHWGREPTAGESDRNRTLNPGVRGKEGGVDQRGGQSRPLSQHGDANITASSSSEALPSVHYFPYPSSHRASQQSKRLQKPFRATSSRPHSTQDLVEVPFNAQDFLLEHSMMLPIVVNTRSSPHGHGFLRFPEELSGEGCFGSTILRVIAGSGYKLYWAPQNAFVRKEESAMNISDADNPTVEVRTRPTSSESEGESESESDSGGCIHVRDRGVMKKFIDTLQRYYLRAVRLRDEGIPNARFRD